ncbi:MAG: GAF domain-containing sensor histidine kinase [Candidatus Omnitrophica bacterium]|nr:GAF domain-containing sensor histidine kinase [Candidatus Omnitrophota bacterium]
MFAFNIILAFLGLVAAIVMAFVVMTKENTANTLRNEVSNLRRALDEMDEQAKLVVRTDIELNKAQEELDKKITGLYTLNRLSRSISSTLEESQVFKRIEPAHIEDLGFTKALAFLFSETERKFILRLTLGYIPEETERIKSFMETHREGLAKLLPAEKTLSSLAADEHAFVEAVREAFGVTFFVFAPVLPKEGSPGLFFVGTDKQDTAITEGDEELITIVANHIGQALENARLFEKTWQAHQNLEKRVEERTKELSRVLEEVKKISQRKNDFVSNVSHELRTPLTSIKGYASILLSGKLGVLPEDVYKRLEKINKHSDELVSFVNELLDISRIESGRVDLKLAPYDFKHIVEEVADLLAVQCREKQIELVTAVDQLPEVLADYSQIKRVLINLINNAIKYTTKGSITLRAARHDAEVRIEVQDTGCGIPEQALDKLFVEFYRVDSAVNQEVKGTGLGLALVKHIIEAHHGTIWVKSKVGEGSTFGFTLPVA